MDKVLFITFNALTEPLGQSQILPYLYGNSSKYNFYVCSLEKYDSVSTPSLVNSVMEYCLQRNIVWLPSKFRSKPKFLSTLLNLIKVGLNSLKIIRNHDVSIIHCRSYLPAFLGIILKKTYKTNFIFDMRGLWIDELLAAGRIKKQTILHRALVYFEKAALINASEIITLTHKSKEFLITNYLIDEKKISVIPTCVEQSLFTDISKKTSGRSDELVKRVGILGTVLSGWFNFEMLISFMQSIKLRWPEVEFHFVTKESSNDILASFKDHSFDIKEFNYKIYPIEREGLAQCISQFDIGAMFYFSESFSEIARSPTKIGEFLACKTPIIINFGIGDTDKIIKDYGVGLLVDRGLLRDADLLNNKIEAMLNDNDIEIRCVRCCEDIFSLDQGISSYNRIYQKLLNFEYE